MSNCTPSVLLTPISMLSKSMKTAIFSRVSAKRSLLSFQLAEQGQRVIMDRSWVQGQFGIEALGALPHPDVVRVDRVLIADEELAA